MKNRTKQTQLTSIPYSIDLGLFLKNKRTMAGVTQAELSRKLELKSPQFISNVERGICAYTIQQLPIVMRVCKISADELMDEFLAAYKTLLKAVIY